MKKLTIALFSVLLMAFITNCNEATKPKNVKQLNPAERIIDYHNGVYYFPYANSPYNVQEDFGNILSAFRKQHPELDLICATGDVTGTSVGSYTKGYYVCFRNKQKE